MSVDYQAILHFPCTALGIRCSDTALVGIDFLELDQIERVAQTDLAQQVCQQLLAYLAQPTFQFDLPLQPMGTLHQQRVWQLMCEIPCGDTRSYGEVAQVLGSAAQAVGQACGANPIPIIVPCHRIVGKQGLGGFAKQKTDHTLNIKRWLLQHEQTIR